MPAGRCHCGAGTALAHFGQQPQTGTPPAATGGRFALASRRFVAAHAQAREAGWVQFRAAAATSDGQQTVVALYYPTLAAPRAIAM